MYKENEVGEYLEEKGFNVKWYWMRNKWCPEVVVGDILAKLWEPRVKFGQEYLESDLEDTEVKMLEEILKSLEGAKDIIFTYEDYEYGIFEMNLSEWFSDLSVSMYRLLDDYDRAKKVEVVK